MLGLPDIHAAKRFAWSILGAILVHALGIMSLQLMTSGNLLPRKAESTLRLRLVGLNSRTYFAKPRSNPNVAQRSTSASVPVSPSEEQPTDVPSKITSPLLSESRAFSNEDIPASIQESSSLDSSHDHAQLDPTRTTAGVTAKKPRPDPASHRIWDRFASCVDLPTHWRLRNTSTRAELIVTATDSLVAVSLTGEPMLRAVLQKAMRTKQCREEVKKILAMSMQRTLRIEVTYTEVPRSYRALADEVVAVSGGVRIEKFLPPPQHVFQGVSLSDSHARRAEARESSERQALMEMPAFTRPLRDERL